MFIALILVLLVSFSSAQAAEIQCVGDSITAPQYVTVPETYCNKLAVSLGYDTIVNAGVSGNDIDDVIARQSTIIGHHSDLVTFMIGTNDANQSVTSGVSNKTSSADYAAKVTSFVQAVLADGSDLIIISPPMSLVAREVPRLASLTEELRRISFEKGVHFVDLYGKMVADSNSLGTADFIQWYRNATTPADLHHLSPTGHQRIAELVLTSVHDNSAPPTGTEEILYSRVFNESFGSMSGKTGRTEIKTSAYNSLTGSPTQMRATIKAGPSEGLIGGSLYVGAKSTGYNTSSMRQVTFSGGLSFTLSISQSLVSDWVAIPSGWSVSTGTIASYYISGGASADGLYAYNDGVNNTSSLCITHINGSGDAASQSSPSGTWYSYPGYCSLIEKIEVR